VTKARKTIALTALIDQTNRLLALPDRQADSLNGNVPVNADMRRAWIGLLDFALHEANAYRGFGYQITELNEDCTGVLPGYDDTRRHYHGGTVPRHVLALYRRECEARGIVVYWADFAARPATVTA
jgi:hypothetical protein